jgi:hypothetical protein
MSLIQQWREAKQAEQDANQRRKDIEAALVNEFSDEIMPQLDPDYKTGTAKLDDGKSVLILTFGKKVEWDNQKLGELYSTILAAGENPEEYIEARYTISETKYKSWPEHIRNSFTPARTVKASNPTFSLKESK